MSTQSPDLTINEEPDGSLTIRLLSEKAREEFIDFFVPIHSHSKGTQPGIMVFGFQYRGARLSYTGEL